ncbi:Pentatricopeptide repeat superfamily protein [Perilla frutescens var. hirtella]|nr:Pentatricopeptide repeat superfamily protein [Perilla frutescens var. hirtella]
MNYLQLSSQNVIPRAFPFLALISAVPDLGLLSSIVQIAYSEIGKEGAPLMAKQRPSWFGTKGNESRSNFLQICGLPNEKEAVYGALDEWIAWETEFPLIAAAKSLRILRSRNQWKRFIHVFADMEELGVKPDEDTFRRIARAFELLGEEDKQKRFLTKYQRNWKYIHFKGERVWVRT